MNATTMLRGRRRIKQYAVGHKGGRKGGKKKRLAICDDQEWVQVCSRINLQTCEKRECPPSLFSI